MLRLSPTPAPGRYCSSRVVNSDGMSYTYTRSGVRVAAGLGSCCCACSGRASDTAPWCAGGGRDGRGSTCCEQSTPNQPAWHQQKPPSHVPRPWQSRRQKACFGCSHSGPVRPSGQPP